MTATNLMARLHIEQCHVLITCQLGNKYIVYHHVHPDVTIMSQVESNKAIINRYFEAYKTKNEGIFDEIIAPDYIDNGQSAYMGSPGRGVAGANNDLKNFIK